VPAKIMKIEDEDHAIVDYGDGTSRRINISLVDVRDGDYVLVHAGFAIQVMDKEEVKATLEAFKEMVEGLNVSFKG